MSSFQQKNMRYKTWKYYRREKSCFVSVPFSAPGVPSRHSQPPPSPILHVWWSQTLAVWKMDCSTCVPCGFCVALSSTLSDLVRGTHKMSICSCASPSTWSLPFLLVSHCCEPAPLLSPASPALFQILCVCGSSQVRGSLASLILSLSRHWFPQAIVTTWCISQDCL